MRLSIHGFGISNLQKADDEASDSILVDVIANHLTPDDIKETVLKEAFNDETVREFMDFGSIDFWHESDNDDLTKEQQLANIIGNPVAFRWENGKPVVTASLTKSHPIVQKMLPNLRARKPVYAASIAGSKMVLETQDATGNTHRIIPKIKWKKLAIAPSHSVINRAPGMNVSLLRKANEICCEFSDIPAFLQHKGMNLEESVLRKALNAPSSLSETYGAGQTSGGVLSRQSIESGKGYFTEEDGLDLIDTLLKIKNQEIPLQEAKYLNYFKKKNKEGFGKKSFDLISKYFNKEKEQ